MKKTRHDETPDVPPDGSEPTGPTTGPDSAPDAATGTTGGKKARRGPPKGNRNAIRHGLLAGKLPADAAYIENRLNGFRRRLEDAVIQAKGEVSLVDAAAINTATKWERHGCLAQRWLRTQGDKLKPTEMLNFSREIAKASTERDKALAALKLDRDATHNAIEALYGRVIDTVTED